MPKLGKKIKKTEHYRPIRNDLLPPQQEVFITACFGAKLQLHRGARQGILMINSVPLPTSEVQCK